MFKPDGIKWMELMTIMLDTEAPKGIQFLTLTSSHCLKSLQASCSGLSVHAIPGIRDTNLHF